MTPEASPSATKGTKDETDSERSPSAGDVRNGCNDPSNGLRVFQKRQLQECVLCGKPRPSSKYQNWSSQRYPLFGGQHKVCYLHLS